MNSVTLNHGRVAEPHHSRAWSVVKAILLALLGLILSGAVLAAQAPTNNSTLPKPDSLTNESLLNLLARSNRAMITTARQAESQVQNGDVKRFAGRLATEHTTMLSSLQQLWGQLGYTAPDSAGAAASPAVSAERITGNDTSSTKPVLSAASDWSYVDQEIAAHTSLLLALQQQTPKVGDQRLRAFVSNVIQTEEAHLRDARELLSRQPKPQESPAGP